MSVSLKEELGPISDAQIERVLRKVLSEQVVLQGSATWDPGSIATAAEAVVEVTVAGAALGDFAVASLSIDVADLTLTACVTAANTVTVQLSNVTGGAIDLASSTVSVRVFPRNNYILA